MHFPQQMIHKTEFLTEIHKDMQTSRNHTRIEFNLNQLISQ